MYWNRIWINNCSVVVFELEMCNCIWIEIWENNVFDLAELYLYLISKCVFGPNPEDSCYQVVELVATKQQYSETQTILHGLLDLIVFK